MNKVKAEFLLWGTVEDQVKERRCKTNAILRAAINEFLASLTP